MAKIAVWELEGGAAFDGVRNYSEAAPRADRSLDVGTLECVLTPKDVRHAVIITNGQPDRENGAFEIRQNDSGALVLRCSNGGVEPITLTTPEWFFSAGDELQVTLSWGERVTFSLVNLTRLHRDPGSQSAGYVERAPLRARVRMVPGKTVTIGAAHEGKAYFFAGEIQRVTVSDSIDEPAITPPSARILHFEDHFRASNRPRRRLPRMPHLRQASDKQVDLSNDDRVYVATAEGERPIGEIVPGDEILTRDNGMQPVRWIGRASIDWASLNRRPHIRPVVIRKGALGHGLPEADLALPPYHRLVARFGEHEELTGARKLAGMEGVFSADALGVRYTHLQFDQTETYLANGVWVEAFNPADDVSGDADFEAQRLELCEIFPALRGAVKRA